MGRQQSKGQKKATREKAKKEEDLFRDEPLFPKQKLHCKVPIAPSVNHMYVMTKKGGRRLTDKAKEYNDTAIALILEAMDEQNWQEDRTCTWYYVDICTYMPDRKKRDTNNMFKILLDVIQRATDIDDYYINVRQQKTELDPDCPRIEFTLKPQLPIDRERKYK
jgi:Holliday junction resolvase RusA-like endonuclease